MTHPFIEALRAGLHAAADPEKARPMQAYMKTSQPFYGVQAVPLRKIFREAARAFPFTSREEYEGVITELWHGEYREEMYMAVETAERYTAYRNPDSWELYERLIHTATNWDTLDWIARKLVSPLVLQHRHFEARLKVWRTSGNFWVRRASLLAHLGYREQTNTQLLAETILLLAAEKEFFIRKAIGWVLRDYSYANPAWVQAFVDRHAAVLSGLSRREALKVIQRRCQS